MCLVRGRDGKSAYNSDEYTVLISRREHAKHEMRSAHIPMLISEFRPNDNITIEPKHSNC